MTAEIVNLRLARKRKVRAQDAKKADERSAQFCQTKLQKSIIKAERESASRHLDAHLISSDDDAGS